MVTNQDGLGTKSFPEDDFWPTHNFLLKAFENEGIVFDEILIDKSFPEDNAPTRKPRTGLLTHYINGDFDLKLSYVIGDRLTDMELAKNLNAKGIFIANDENLGAAESNARVSDVIALKTTDWESIYHFLKHKARRVVKERKTHETEITLDLNLDGTGKSNITTGLPFFDHMLDQLASWGYGFIPQRSR